jgi:hypothetical protein
VCVEPMKRVAHENTDRKKDKKTICTWTGLTRLVF